MDGRVPPGNKGQESKCGAPGWGAPRVDVSMSWKHLSTVERVVVVFVMVPGTVALVFVLSEGWDAFMGVMAIIFLTIGLGLLAKDKDAEQQQVVVVERPLPPQVIVVQAPVQAALGPSTAPALPALPALPARVEPLAKPYNPAKAGELLDCCANCIDRPLCYANQGELNAKWDYKCPDYQRDTTLSRNRVVDVAKLKPKGGAK